MYGLINQAIQDLVIEKFGQETWAKVKVEGGVNIDRFLSNESYNDSITFDLANAVARVTKLSLKDILFAFGEYWVLKTGAEKYGSLMKAGGDNLKEFLMNLPNFHSRVMLMFPNITPPEFNITDVAENSLVLHYYSTRTGLTDFMHGLINGLAILYKVSAKIVLKSSKTDNNNHDIFEVSW